MENEVGKTSNTSEESPQTATSGKSRKSGISATITEPVIEKPSAQSRKPMKPGRSNSEPKTRVVGFSKPQSSGSEKRNSTNSKEASKNDRSTTKKSNPTPSASDEADNEVEILGTKKGKRKKDESSDEESLIDEEGDEENSQNGDDEPSDRDEDGSSSKKIVKA